MEPVKNSWWRRFWYGETIFDDSLKVQTAPSGTKYVSPVAVLLDAEMVRIMQEAGQETVFDREANESEHESEALHKASHELATS